MGLGNGTESRSKKEASNMNDAATKTSQAKGTSTSAAGKKPKAKPKKERKPKVEKTPKEDQVVFAFRLSKAQRDRIHKAAGPGKATRFVRAAALAASDGDRSAFDQLLKK
jgi:hypothetical protein